MEKLATIGLPWAAGADLRWGCFLGRMGIWSGSTYRELRNGSSDAPSLDALSTAATPQQHPEQVEHETHAQGHGDGRICRERYRGPCDHSVLGHRELLLELVSLRFSWPGPRGI